MRRKREKRSAVPEKYRRYRPEQWPGGPGEWVSEREAWAKAQPAILITGADSYGAFWRCTVAPLGDSTSLMRARREARMTAYAGS